MLIKKPYTGTRLGLGDVDPVQPLNTAHPLLRGVQGFWLALPHLSGGTRFYNLIQPRGTGSISGATWRDFSEVPRSGLHHDGSSFVDTGVERLGSTGLFASASEEYTVITEARVQPDGLGSVLGRAVSSFSARTFHMHFNQDEETPQVVIRGQSNFTDAALDDGRFHSHAVTWDGSAATYIVDGGSLVLPLGVGNQSENTGQRIVFAARTNGTGFRLNGDQTYVLIADRAYSAKEVASFHDQARRGFPDLLNRRPSMTVVDMAVAPPDAVEADVTTTQAAQLTSADTLVYRTLDAATLQALQTVTASVTGIFDASASTRQQQQRAEAAAEVVAIITLDAVTRQAQQGTAASILLRAKIDALTRQQPQLAQVAAEIVGIISASTRQQPQRATADPQRTTRVSVGTQQQPQTAAATALVASILQTVTRQLPQRTTAAFGDLVRARIQATSIRRAIDLQTSITRP